MGRPEVSILMSVYNGDRFLKKAIASILAQSFSNFELIILNDGSTDTTASITESFVDPRIRFINRKENIGLTRSLIEGMQSCRAPFIARMDADDISAPNRIELLYQFLSSHPGTGAVTSFVEFMTDSDEGYWQWQIPVEPAQLRARFLNGEFISHGSVMFTKDAYERAGGYRAAFQFAQDADLWLRLSEVADISAVDQCLYRQRRSITRLSVRHCHAQIHFILLALLLTDQRAREGRDSLDASMCLSQEALFETVCKFYLNNENFYERFIQKNTNKIVHELNSAGKYLTGMQLQLKTRQLLFNFRRFCKNAT